MGSTIFRGPTARNTFVFCIILGLVFHFRLWNLYRDDEAVPVTPASHAGGSSGSSGAVVVVGDSVYQGTEEEEPSHTAVPVPPPAQASQQPASAAEAAAGSGSGAFPKKIWYKLGPKGLSTYAKEWTDSCINQNPGYSVEFMTDETGDAFVNANFASHPDILEVYNALTVPILKADMLRYMLLYVEGGVWFDLDASCEGTPISDWVPAAHADEAQLVVGWEFDGGYHFEFERQFVTWTVMAKPKVPHMLVVIREIAESLRRMAEANHVGVDDLTITMIGDVIEATGPKRFHKSVVGSLEKSVSEPINWEEYHEILEPKMAGDILILPGYSLAASYNTYEPEDQGRVGPSLVVHHYAGTWKNEHGGETRD
ncbi:U4/U6 x U5 tri-snRNP complex subunit Prp1 [Pestalotiopsis sp. IQ-011]